MYALFFDGFHLDEVSVERKGTVTVQELRPSTGFTSIADLVYSCKRLVLDAKGRVIFDPSRILAGSESDSWLIHRGIIDGIADGLLRGRVLLKIGLGPPDGHIAKWYEYGGIRDDE